MLGSNPDADITWKVVGAVHCQETLQQGTKLNAEMIWRLLQAGWDGGANLEWTPAVPPLTAIGRKWLRERKRTL